MEKKKKVTEKEIINPRIINIDIFKINLNFKINYEYIDNHKIIVIDNFYKYPDEVRNFAFNLPVYSMEWGNHNIESYRGNWVANEKDVQEYSKVLNYLLPHDVEINMMAFTFYKFLKDKKKYKNKNHIWNIPHIDRMYNGIIYLNKKEECSGGTSFFEHKKTKDFFIDNNNMNKYWNYVRDIKVNDDIENNYKHNWNILKTIKMKYNRLILFNGSLFHSINFGKLEKPNSFNDNFRITQNFYL